jgi:predicted phosphodiesterase
MRIIATSDLHYDIARSKRPAEAIAEDICKRGGDVLMLIGDSASSDTAILDQVFGLFESFKGERLAVAGNHELWTTGGDDSLHRYEDELSEACRRGGFHYLDAAPLRLGEMAFVGNVGWYDFGFRERAMGIPLRFYEHKVSPGAAAHLDKYKHLVDDRDDVPRAALSVTCRWMDGERVRLPFTDAEFTQQAVVRLRSHLDEVEASVEQIVVGIHHLPFVELVPRTIVPSLAFAAGFLGSELLGQALLDYPKVRHVFCGHSHRKKTCRKNGMVCTSIGSTYKEKRYEVLDV